MKTIWMLGLWSLLLMAAYNKVAGGSSEAAQSPDGSVIRSVPVAMERDGNLPAGISEYVLLHQTRYDIIPVNTMAGVRACPE